MSPAQSFGVAPIDAAGARAAAALRQFRAHFGLSADGEDLAALSRLCRAFAQLPYENLTKILKHSRTCTKARREVDEVVADHILHGTGGTCFSLTAALVALLRAAGWSAAPILADRHYGVDTHCAVRVEVAGVAYLLDPGYLLVEPIPLAAAQAGPLRIAAAAGAIELVPSATGERIDLLTIQGGQRSRRLTFKAAAVDERTFGRAWDESFAFDMMRYPVLTRHSGTSHLYLQANRMQVRGAAGTTREVIDPVALPQRIAAEFGIDARLVATALAVLHRRGAGHGADAY